MVFSGEVSSRFHIVWQIELHLNKNNMLAEEKAWRRFVERRKIFKIKEFCLFNGNCPAGLDLAVAND